MENEDCTNLGDWDINVQGEDGCHLPNGDHFLEASKPNVNNVEIVEETELGKEFTSKEDAYKFYSDYGGRIGFSVRKQHQKRNKEGVVTRITFCCSKEGYKKEDKRCDKSFVKPVSRVGCKAELSCLLQKNGNYKVVSFYKSHNHELIRTPMKHMLRTNPRMSKAQKAHSEDADDADKSGIPIKAIVELMSREVGGHEHLGFLDKDYRNYLHHKRKLGMKKGDAGAILQYFQKMHSKNSSFFYSIQLDEDDMITNIFWADARSVSDYGLFGDVVCFDTTYRTNEFGRPFALFVGVNHHKQTLIFGVTLLYDDSAESFKWLFQTFLDAMWGKQPKTILTDQTAAMANAIVEVFPDTHHRLCVWHIYQNAAKHLSDVFDRSKEFVSDFSKCIYDYEDKDEWLLAWNNMLEQYTLQENNWLMSVFELKEKWALVYGRHTFTADMKSTQRSEGMNNVLKKYLNPRHDLLCFFEHYERVLVDRRYAELLADFNMVYTTPAVVTSAEMLRHAVEIYTPEVFKLFQKEYISILDCSIYKVGKDEMKSEYKVSYRGKSENLITFEASTQMVSCSCMKFTFIGILCTHALKVLDKKNVKRIPSQYILKRWTRDAKAKSIIEYHHGVGISNDPQESMGKRYSHLCRNFREIAICASEHEMLFSYAHERLFELLRKLEEMKKDLSLDGTFTNHNSQGTSYDMR